jgi:hypothetical protein
VSAGRAERGSGGTLFGMPSDEFDEVGCPALMNCDDEDHSGCPHVPFHDAYVRLNPGLTASWPARPSQAIFLCICRCHAACPLASFDPSQWPGSCTCNGTLRMLDNKAQRKDSGDGEQARSINLGGIVSTGIRETLHKRAARHAVQRRSAELDDHEVRELVAQEWANHGLDPPGTVAADRIADEIAHPPGPVERAQRRLRLARDLVGMPLRLHKATRGGLGETIERAGRDRGKVYEMATGRDPVEVHLASGSAAQLDRIARRAVALPSLMAVAKVELRLSHDGQIEVWDYRPDEPPPELPIGSLPSSDSTRAGELVRIALAVNQPCVCPAAVLRTRDGPWQLLVRRPLTKHPPPGP